MKTDSREAFLKKQIAAKDRLRKKLMKLSFFEKIQRVIEMQKMAKKLSKKSADKLYVWNP